MTNLMMPSKAVRKEIDILCTNKGSTPFHTVSGQVYLADTETAK